MALTDTQKAKIRQYLGWSARYHTNDDALEKAMVTIGDLPEDEARVTAALTVLETLDTELTEARGRLKASVVGSITLNANEIAWLRSEGRRVVKRIAAILGVEIRSDAFGSGGSRGGVIKHG